MTEATVPKKIRKKELEGLQMK